MVMEACKVEGFGFDGVFDLSVDSICLFFFSFDLSVDSMLSVCRHITVPPYRQIAIKKKKTDSHTKICTPRSLDGLE